LLLFLELLLDLLLLLLVLQVDFMNLGLERWNVEKFVHEDLVRSLQFLLCLFLLLPLFFFPFTFLVELLFVSCFQKFLLLLFLFLQFNLFQHSQLHLLLHLTVLLYLLSDSVLFILKLFGLIMFPLQLFLEPFSFCVFLAFNFLEFLLVLKLLLLNLLFHVLLVGFFDIFILSFHL
jgi:hypothetical protein